MQKGVAASAKGNQLLTRESQQPCHKNMTGQNHDDKNKVVSKLYFAR